MSKAKSWMMVTLTVFGLFGGRALAGVLDSPVTITNSSSAMFTLNDIYNVLDTRTTNVAKRTGVFTEPTTGPTAGTMHTLNDIMALVTNRAPVQKTGLATSYTTNDDGWCSTNVGVAWPSTRFTVGTGTSSNCVTDTLTGLMWLKNPDAGVSLTWTNAVVYCKGLDGSAGRGGYADWRLPNIRELESLINYGTKNPALPAGHPFIGVQSSLYWASTTRQGTPADAWSVNFAEGPTAYAGVKASTPYYVWAVRGGN